MTPIKNKYVRRESNRIEEKNESNQIETTIESNQIENKLSQIQSERADSMELRIPMMEIVSNT